MIRIIGSGRPVKLIVGGLHGAEGEVTEKILFNIPFKVRAGTVVLSNLSLRSRYISTLKPQYYETEVGRKLIHLIDTFSPEIYLELHTYRKNRISQLLDPERERKIGVPPLVELEEGILLGSIPPQLRAKKFRRGDLCLTLEAPSDIKLHDPALKRIIQTVTLSRSGIEVLDRLRSMYPKPVRRAIKLYEEWNLGFREGI